MNIKRIGLDWTEIALRESLFHVANGYLGVRACFEEGAPSGISSIRGTYLNAFYDLTPLVYAEKMHGFPTEAQTIVNVVDMQGVSLMLDSEPFDPFSGELLLFEQTLDMAEGHYTRHVVWRSPNGKETELSFRRMVSFSVKELMTLEVTVTPRNWSGDFRAISTQNSDVYNDGDPNDPRKASETVKRLRTLESGQQGKLCYMLCQTAKSQLTMACVMAHTFGSDLQSECGITPECNTVQLSGQAKQGVAISFVKRCVYTDSRRHAAPLTNALALAAACSAQPLSTLYERQREILNDFWRVSRVTVVGEPQLQTAIDYAIFVLFQSAGQDGVSSIPSKGLSGEGYEGHYFWDTEIYMFPFFLLTRPDLARALLDFRFSTLPQAKEQARLLGHQKGALYPWRTITGSECSAYFPSGSAQYHINSDIAHAVITYYFTTGDTDYMLNKGLEILIETSRLWLDVGHWYEGQFRIDGVTGPDEYTCLVNNNYYTNLSAQYQLHNTLLICSQLEHACPAFSALDRYGFTAAEKQSFQAAGDCMYLPYDEKLGVFAQDDSFLQKQRMELNELPKGALPMLLSLHPLAFYRKQVCKQADAVLAHFLYEDGLTDDVIRRTYEYYEALTTHDSSLSPCVFSMMAARIGQPEKAYNYYRYTAMMDLENRHHNTDDGIHAASLGGAYMGIVFGFAGLRIHADGLSFRPCLPRALSGYGFPVHYRGARIRLQVDHGTIRLWLEHEGAMSVSVYGESHTVTAEPITIPLRQANG